MAGLKIGEVARRSGVAVDTVRYYERRGVLPPAARRASGYRAFAPATVERIRFAKSLQALGFTLDEVVELLRAIDSGEASCEQESPRLATVLARIDAQLASLRTVRRRLARTMRRCADGACTVLDQAVTLRAGAGPTGA